MNRFTGSVIIYQNLYHRRIPPTIVNSFINNRKYLSYDGDEETGEIFGEPLYKKKAIDQLIEKIDSPDPIETKRLFKQLIHHQQDNFDYEIVDYDDQIFRLVNALYVSGGKVTNVIGEPVEVDPVLDKALKKNDLSGVMFEECDEFFDFVRFDTVWCRIFRMDNYKRIKIYKGGREIICAVHDSESG